MAMCHVGTQASMHQQHACMHEMRYQAVESHCSRLGNFLKRYDRMVSQEADLQRHSKRLMREGKLQEMAGRRLGGHITKTITDSSASFEAAALFPAQCFLS